MIDSSHPPLKREEVLAPFSRDHYTGLAQSSRLRKATSDDSVACARLAADFIGAWDREIAVHFDDEERLLLERMNETDRQRMLREHRQIRDLVASLQQPGDGTPPDSAALRELGELLETHIRWEERDLFNRIQAALDESQRRELESQTVAIDAARGRKPRPPRT